MDNLQSTTYQTFEQDPVKYHHYEEAMYRALVDWTSADKVVFCIAGAGRGPIVQRCLNAIDRAKKPALVYAIEKNPNAYVTLQSRVKNEWKDRVTLLYGDMRYIEVPEKVDILVSELLGSFGDNELSPECLDGAMRLLKPTGISIPSSYTAHLAPLSSSKLYNEARVGKEEKHLETPYVVMFQAMNLLSGDGGGVSGHCGRKIQECWEFVHPRRDVVFGPSGLPLTNSHNTRSAKLAFHIPHAGILHGFAGYFEAVLYGNIGLSIHPEGMDKISKDMLSWFPLFFPLKEPIYLPSNSELHVSLWRLTDQRQVWYEWYTEAFLCLPTLQAGIQPAKRDSNSALSPQTIGLGGGLSRDILGSISSPMMMASPLIDAVDLVGEGSPAGEQRSGSGKTVVDPTPSGAANVEYTLVKISQSSLHNPCGRSSWIGL
ncbi:hypothetical protein ONZ45_g14922 [Pleurotus djamor]|nr:hypothetical protein ONZ45_g14922 [Pleurotus djamor]